MFSFINADFVTGLGVGVFLTSCLWGASNHWLEKKGWLKWPEH